MRSALALSVLLLLSAAPAAAQHAQLPPPRFYAGIAAQLAQPTGEFGDSVDAGFGLDANLLYRVDPAGILGIRLDAGFLVYGHEEHPVMLSPTVGGRITADLATTNNVFFLTAGPQVMLPGRQLRPYLNATAGLAYFATSSSLRPDHGEPYATTTNHDDMVFTYGGGAGLYVPLGRGRVPVALDIGARYRHTPEVSYLREGSIRDLPGGEIAFDPIVSETDLFEFQVGVEVGLRRSDRRCRRC